MDSGLVGIGAVARELQVSTSWVRKLTDDGALPSQLSAGGHRRYDLSAVRVAWSARKTATARPSSSVNVQPDGLPLVADRDLPLEGLEEDVVWRELVDTLHLPEAARRILAYAFTEMLNNAIDHSSGNRAHVQVWRSNTLVAFEIADDGRGIFEHLRTAFDLPDHPAAISELTKGKRTTAREGHSGEGIFFTSKAVDRFALASDGWEWVVDNKRADHAVGTLPVTPGTVVRVELDPATTRDLATLFGEYTEDSEFTRTRPVVKLFNVGVEFVSRSEAKRLLVGMEEFTQVEVDFAGVTSVGQGFVDQLLRVWPTDHPGTRIVPTNMNRAVAFMVARGLPNHPRDPGPDDPAADLPTPG
jgi:STAS-like domain of unknown function (DUF4325)/Histidine kinase-like ATPase domain